jgi:16S rRNA (uracil1498-N3)-methyltransferase
MPRFFLPAVQIQNNRAVLTGPEFHHLRHVLRLTTGRNITVYDEYGTEYQGSIVGLSATCAEIVLAASSRASPDSRPLTLAQGLLKGPKMDLVIEKATELGVRTIVPFLSSRTVVRLSTERYTARLERWRRLTQSAAKQSGNPPPLITRLHSFHDLLTTVPDGAAKILLYEQERTLTLKALAHTQPAFPALWVVVGPEGGFTAEEIDQARAAGFHIVSLGSHIVRAETASIVAVGLCRFLWGPDTVPPLPSP